MLEDPVSLVEAVEPTPLTQLELVADVAFLTLDDDVRGTGGAALVVLMQDRGVWFQSITGREDRR